MTETEARMINEFVAGDDVPTIAARYSVSEDYVDQLVDQTHIDEPAKRRFDWSFRPWGNRLLYCLAAGLAVKLATDSFPIGAVIAVVLFALTSAIVTTRRD